ncbi:MAG: hypothetical protein AB1894_02895 [Chloroflexota bacterium]
MSLSTGLAAESLGQNRLTIEHLNCVYLVPRQHPNPESVRHRLDALAQKNLAAACAQSLEPNLDPHDPSVWLIRRLDVHLVPELNRMPEVAFARAWGERLAGQIVGAIRRGPDGVNVLRFPDRAAYLAFFIGDLVAGLAWNRWYFSAFNHLAGLETGQVIEAVLSLEPEPAPQVLRVLHAQNLLESVLALLRPAQVETIADLCSAGAGGSAALYQALEGLMAVWSQTGLEREATRLPHDALRLFAAAYHHSPHLSPGALIVSARRLLRLAVWPAPAGRRGSLLAAVAQGDWRARELILPEESGLEESLDFLRGVAGEDAGLARRALQVALEVPVASVVTQAPSALASNFVSVLLCAAAMIDLDLPGILARLFYPDQPDFPSETALRVVTLMKCMGAENARDALADSVFRLLVGAEQIPEPENWPSLDAPDVHQQAMRLLAARQVELGLAGARCLLATVEKDPHGPVLLLRDVESDLWLYAWQLEPPVDDAALASALRSALALLDTALGRPVECLALGEGFPAGERLTDLAFSGCLIWLQAAPGLQPLRLSGRNGAGFDIWLRPKDALPVALHVPLGAALARLRPAGPDLDFYSLAGVVPLTPQADLTWSLASHTVHRCVAARFPGFAGSSAGYLYRNFLVGRGRLVRLGGSFYARLPHSPLEIVMRMAGIDGQRLELPWLDGILVFLELSQG